MPDTRAFDSLTAIYDSGFDEVLDVRSPSEFAEDHVPGAVSVPVLSDEERARVGTIYKQESAFKARRIGAALVARNAARHIETHLATRDGGYRPLVYCWRGGQRSNSFAIILRQVGWRAETVEGGYKAYRGLVVNALYRQDFPAPIVLIAGVTGVAKTALLQRLPAHGIQTLDLEGLANHRGSLFGGMGAQPSQKAFETKLARAVEALDPSRPVAVEAESSKVGERALPPPLWKAMRAAPAVEVTAPIHARAAFTARTYAAVTADRGRLTRILDKLRPYHARRIVDDWQELAATGAVQDGITAARLMDRLRAFMPDEFNRHTDFAALAAAGPDAVLAATLMSKHYDARYKRQAEKDGQVVSTLSLDDLSDAALDEAAPRLADLIRQAHAGRASL